MYNEWELRKHIVEVGKRIWTRGYVAANDGNITVLLNDDEVLTTPTGVSKGFMTTDMIIKCDRQGNVITKNSKYRPSSELKMHLEVYRERPDVKSVVHAHPPYATSFAVAGIPLDKCVLPEAIIVIGAVPIAPYGLPSTSEIPDNIRPYIKNSDAILLENHGALTLGSDLFNAYYKMETLEHTASIVWKAIQLGNLNVLSPEERDRLLGLREKFNLPGRVTVCSTDANSAAQNKDPQPQKLNESMIQDIVEQVLTNLKSKLTK
ncbi:class II aldolase/adducin family protein [Melioribacter roseus P3M-2]|uniref:Class II aldolase/adducin family protein n=1 Tax=Melioribacter roseus (strain DSM 23840 / JCM 17771 / VKM B-2668 / P3M-2) TaxID=1191523 RepID=I6ZMU4_MELRP|nr:class II aldolase/adducin family protein [Melioribacter roseus]AFN73339.1 class II aldolase/adducin family protein [Melioribacter roseus P3M-2]